MYIILINLIILYVHNVYGSPLTYNGNNTGIICIDCFGANITLDAQFSTNQLTFDYPQLTFNIFIDNILYESMNYYETGQYSYYIEKCQYMNITYSIELNGNIQYNIDYLRVKMCNIIITFISLGSALTLSCILFLLILLIIGCSAYIARLKDESNEPSDEFANRGLFENINRRDIEMQEIDV